MTVILDLIFAKKCQHRYAHNNFCFRDFYFHEWCQDSRNLNPTKIMPYTVLLLLTFNTTSNEQEPILQVNRAAVSSY